MTNKEKQIITMSLTTFLGLLITITIDPIIGSYIMLTGLMSLTTKVFIWELNNACKTC